MYISKHKDKYVIVLSDKESSLLRGVSNIPVWSNSSPTIGKFCKILCEGLGDLGSALAWMRVEPHGAYNVDVFFSDSDKEEEYTTPDLPKDEEEKEQ